MKASEIQKCALCRKGVMHTGLPLFYQIEVQRHSINVGEVQRMHGMEQFMGGQIALARIFHDPDITQPVSDKLTLSICETCALHPHPLAMLIESADKPTEQKTQTEQEVQS
jgi:hypothetical protein